MKKQFDFESSSSKIRFVSLSKRIGHVMSDKQVEFINGFFNYHTEKILKLLRTDGNESKIIDSIIPLDMFNMYVHIKPFLLEKAIVIRKSHDAELTKLFKNLLRNNRIFQTNYFNEDANTNLLRQVTNENYILIDKINNRIEHLKLIRVQSN